MRVRFFTPGHLSDLPRLRQSRPAHAVTTLAACALVALLVLAGCGITTTSGATSAPPSAAGASATATSHANPCPGPAGSVNDAGTAALVLTPQTANRSGSAHVGALVQVRLPDTSHWDYLSTSSLAPLSPAGLHDATVGVCVWNFRPRSAGSVRLSFARSAICHPGTPCPLYLQQVGFTLQVTQ